MNGRKIAVVVPVFCEEENIQPFFSRLKRCTSEISSYAWHYIFINDGSTDNSLGVLREIVARHPGVSVVDLSRNFGKEIALSVGLNEAKNADAVICIDADLQHPPEIIPSLIEKWESGSEIVFTVRRSTENVTVIREFGSRLFYWLLAKVSGLKMVPQTTDYGLYEKKVVAAFLKITERQRFFRGIMDWLGFRRSYVSFSASARFSGDAGYTFPKLWALAISGITSFSLWPLRLTGYLGVAITVISATLLIWMLGNFLLGSSLNYTPLAIFVVANTFLIGIVLISIGLVSLYIGNIHTEVINRPLYIVRERFGDVDRSIVGVERS